MDQLHIDHVVPVSRGGSNDERNLLTACKDCNLAKGATVLDGRRISSKVRHFRKQRRTFAKDEIARLEQRMVQADRKERKLIRERISSLEQIAGKRRRWWLLWLG